MPQYHVTDPNTGLTLSLEGDSEPTEQELEDIFSQHAPKTNTVKGLLEPGNINLNNRPIVRHPDGSYSTVKSASFDFGGQEVLLPTVSDDGRMLSNDEAIALYRKTGKHLGKFDSPDSATAYAKQLHEEQAKQYDAAAQVPKAQPLWKSALSVIRPLAQQFVQAPIEMQQNVLKVPEAVAKLGEPVQETASAVASDFLRRTGIDPSAMPGRNIIDIPSIEERMGQQRFLQLPKSVQALVGYHDALAKTASGFTEPGQASLLPLLGTKPAQAVIAAQSLASAPALGRQLAEAKTPSEVAGALTEGGVNALIGAVVGGHLAREVGMPAEVPRPPEAPHVPSEPAPAVEPPKPGPEPILSTEQATVPKEPTPTPEAPIVPTVGAQPKVSDVGPGMGGALLGETTAGTGLKNAIGEVERAQRGLPEATPTQKQAMATTWIAAGEELQANPKAGEVIVQELKNDPTRGLTDVDSAVLLRHKVAVENALNDAAERTITAKTDAERAIAQDEHARLSDQLLEILDMAKERGSQWGREGRWRQAIADEDFRLSTMETKMRQAVGGRRLTDTEHAQLVELNQKLKARVAELEAAQKAGSQAGREKAASQAVDEAGKSAGKPKPAKPPDEEIADLKGKIGARVERQEHGNITPFVKRLAEQLWLKGVRGLDPMIDNLHGILKEFLPDISRIETMDALSGRGQFSLPNPEAVKVAIRDLSAQSRLAAHIEDVQARRPLPRTGPQRDLPTAEQRRLEQQLEELKRKFGVVVTDPAAQLASALSAAKTYTRNRIADLKAEIASRERIVKTKTPLAPDAELEAMRRELESVKTEHESVFGKRGVSLETQKTQLESQIAELERRIREGDVQPKPSQVNRPADPMLEPLKQRREELSRQLAEMRKTPAEQKLMEQRARQLEALNKEIAAREEKLAKGDLSAQGKPRQVSRPMPTEELETARQRLDAVNKEIAEARKAARAKTPEEIEQQKIEVAGRILDRQIAQLEADLEAGRLTTQKRVSTTPETPELLAKRSWLQALREYRQDLRDAANPKLTPEQRALKMVKTRIAKQMAEYLDKIAKGDYSKKVRTPTPLDQEALRAKASLERVKQEFREGLERKRLEGRSMREKVRDFIGRWRREFVLSGPSSVLKLMAAAVEGLIIDPTKEVVGMGVSKAFQRFAERTELERPSSVAIEAKAAAETFRHLLDDFGQTIRTSKSTIEAAYGGKDAVPPEMQAYMGRLHAALKTPLKRQAWTREVEILNRDYLNKGIDIHDPLIQIQIGNKAMRQANRALFLEDNIVVDAYQRLLSRFEQVKPGEKPTIAQTAGAIALRTALPVIRIPTNLVARTFQAGFGGFVGGIKLAVAYAKGIDTLPPEQADLIMRQLKAGSIGSASMLLGFLAPQMFGGYYEPGKKREPGELKPGHTKIAGIDIPPYLQHRPELQIAQFGATVRRVMDERTGKYSLENKGISEGALAASIGLIEETPFINEMFNLGKARQAPGKWLGAEVAGVITPQLVSQAAKATDKDVYGNPIKRNATTFGEQVKVGIPGLRQSVPPAKQQ